MIEVMHKRPLSSCFGLGLSMSVVIIAIDSHASLCKPGVHCSMVLISAFTAVCWPATEPQHLGVINDVELLCWCR